jgi:transposase
MLAQTLRKRDIVVTDYLSSHNVAGMRKAVEAEGAELFCLPAYSPDPNPIELAFAKLEAPLRASGTRRRTVQ